MAQGLGEMKWDVMEYLGIEHDNGVVDVFEGGFPVLTGCYFHTQVDFIGNHAYQCRNDLLGTWFVLIR